MEDFDSVGSMQPEDIQRLREETTGVCPSHAGLDLAEALSSVSVSGRLEKIETWCRNMCRRFEVKLGTMDYEHMAQVARALEEKERMAYMKVLNECSIEKPTVENGLSVYPVRMINPRD